MNRKTLISFFTIIMLVISLLLFSSCGEGELDENTQPTIKPISDITLDVGDERTVEVNITDADVDDTHTIRASSDDTSVATVLVDEASLTITGKAAGTATITVSATDDSSENNAEANQVTFKVSINNPPPDETPEEPIDPYQPLEGLVVSNGRVQFLFASAGRCINLGGANINGVTYNTHYSKWQRREDTTSPWIDVPDTKKDGGLCSYTPTSSGQYRLVCEISIDGERGKYSSENILIVE